MKLNLILRKQIQSDKRFYRFNSDTPTQPLSEHDGRMLRTQNIFV